MLITLRNQFTESVRVFFQRLGYHAEVGYRGDEAYARRVGALSYPRFHLYIQSASPHHVTFRMHLDQKRPSYHGSHAHAAEYDGPALEAEARRIRQHVSR